MTQSEVGHKLRVESVTISRWERDEGQPQARYIVALAKLFDVTADYLLLGDAAPRPKVPTPAALTKFLATRTGQLARDHELVDALMSLHTLTRTPVTVAQYKMITIALLKDELDS